MDSIAFAVLLEKRKQNRIEKLKRKILRDKANIFDLPEANFRSCFSLSKDAFNYVLKEIEPFVKLSSIPLVQKLAATLRFLAEGSYQRAVGKDVDIGLARPTISKALTEIICVLESKICNKWISLHMNAEEKQNSTKYFMENYGFPGVIGCLDGTHIRILKPHRDPSLYYNREGYYSINTLIICDYKMRVKAVDATHHGSFHEAPIWLVSEARNFFCEKFESGERGSWLLADAGFALDPFVITPFKNAQSGTIQARFNSKHSAARNLVDRTIGNLKVRFKCLLNTLHYNPSKVVKIINVCCALHNICKHFKVDIQEEEPPEQTNNRPVYYTEEVGEFAEEASRIRDEIAKKMCS